MATQQQGQPADVATPEMPGDETAPDMSQGYTIEIKVGADQSISVGVEPNTEEDAEEQGEAGGAEETQQVGNIREACKLVMAIFAASGEMQDSGADDAQMAAGYKPGM